MQCSCVTKSTGKVSLQFDTTVDCICKVKCLTLLIIVLHSSWVLCGGDQRQSSNDQMGDGERLRHDYFICCWRKLYSWCEFSGYFVFNDVWCTNWVSFFWQCQKLIQINTYFYFFKVDVSAALQGWVGESFQILVDEKVKPIWKDTHFTIKYRSDALFDFPYWFGCSKRQFKVCFNK